MKSIGEVAAQFGLPTHVLRHWEAEGLLKPARAGDRRRYNNADLYRVAAILISKEAGLGLADIRTMLAARSAPARHEVMAGHRERLLARIARAQAALDMLEGGLECPHDDIMTCPHFQGLLADRLQPPSMTGSDGRNTDRAVELAYGNHEDAPDELDIVGRPDPDRVKSDIDQQDAAATRRGPARRTQAGKRR
ncbi:MerR family transcriptional regulator [Nocardia sp. NPDC049190]|uniref:MerR family transcriptional regulator n=1 Tax=Nocardia sp. NPDC049190 TaxID=3155650 RepID=UPI0033EBC0AE